MENNETNRSYSYRDYQSELLDVMKSKLSPAVLKEKIEDYHANDIALALEDMTPTERRRLYRLVDAEMLADIFSYLEDDAEIYLDEMNKKTKREMMSEMDADEAVELLRSVDYEDRAQLIDAVDEETKRDITIITSFDEDEIGSQLTTNFIVLDKNITVPKAMKSLISQAEDNDNITTLYVVDDNEVFYGAIDLKDLITARKQTDFESLISTSYPYVYAREEIDDCIERLRQYSEDSIPVLDDHNKLLGVITSQTMVELITDEHEEDYAKLAGLSEEEELEESVAVSVKKRLPWLLVLLVLGMAVSCVVGIFEQVMTQLTVLVCFQSMILGMSGNVGTQSLAVTIRVLMDDRLTSQDRRHLLFKELRVGFTNGLLLGMVAVVVAALYLLVASDLALVQCFAVSGCVGAALLLAMTVSSFFGTFIPMLFQKLDIDPAVASGPLITTLNDLVAVLSYYGLAWLFLLQLFPL